MLASTTQNVWNCSTIESESLDFKNEDHANDNVLRWFRQGCFCLVTSWQQIFTYLPQRAWRVFEKDWYPIRDSSVYQIDNENDHDNIGYHETYNTSSCWTSAQEKWVVKRTPWQRTERKCMNNERVTVLHLLHLLHIPRLFHRLQFHPTMSISSWFQDYSFVMCIVRFIISSSYLHFFESFSYRLSYVLEPWSEIMLGL